MKFIYKKEIYCSYLGKIKSLCLMMNFLDNFCIINIYIVIIIKMLYIFVYNEGYRNIYSIEK